MFILTFNKSRSKKFQHALNHAVNLGATYDGETVRLDILLRNNMVQGNNSPAGQ